MKYEPAEGQLSHLRYLTILSDITKVSSEQTKINPSNQQYFLQTVFFSYLIKSHSAASPEGLLFGGFP